MLVIVQTPSMSAAGHQFPRPPLLVRILRVRHKTRADRSIEHQVEGRASPAGNLANIDLMFVEYGHNVVGCQCKMPPTEVGCPRDYR
jgi:hypothetical protein